ncbi:Long-chain-fatty-acid--[acyl-carrier-protein] ligase AEE15, chloroplastic [Vitis vinifera]|uniref:Long-chain-fatty-acid--[acyl-carrier-protein] ligase AEE15, chloroplastic n=1 Tax=Vitis vinifera TaxID=29760 RepID=A0A438C976_VITVI|nr:Long-chain-fatty-acid--[acyl-carrier-protein] ligase AEE15, chloroplastic [Vitis vinifera]
MVEKGMGVGDSFFNWKELVWSTWLFCGEEKEKSMEGRSLLLLEQEILDFSEGLRAIGVKPDEKLALFADNSCRWLIADQGLLPVVLEVTVVQGNWSKDHSFFYLDGLHIKRYSSKREKESCGHLRFIVVIWSSKITVGRRDFDRMVRDYELDKPPLRNKNIFYLIKHVRDNCWLKTGSFLFLKVGWLSPHSILESLPRPSSCHIGSMFGELKRERMSILKEIELINSLEQSGNMIEDLKSLRASRKLKPEQILLRKRWFGGRKQSEMG